jgi:hypothetical protein
MQPWQPRYKDRVLLTPPTYTLLQPAPQCRSGAWLFEFTRPIRPSVRLQVPAGWILTLDRLSQSELPAEDYGFIPSASVYSA